jgi:hypothetical protein
MVARTDHTQGGREADVGGGAVRRR